MASSSPSEVERLVEDEEIDAGDEDLGERAEGGSEHGASLLHAVGEQEVPNARRHYALHARAPETLDTRSASAISMLSAECSSYTVHHRGDLHGPPEGPHGKAGPLDRQGQRPGLDEAE